MLLKNYILLPLCIVLLAWAVFIWSRVYNADMNVFAVYPRSAAGLTGILTSPFIHGSWQHLLLNTPPLLVTMILIGYFYRSIALRACLLIWLFSGVLLWAFGRQAYHEGASGVIYGYVFFILVGGFIRRNRRLAVISLLVVLFYGSMVWGVLPQKGAISWDGHLFGAAAGVIFALIFRHKGPIEDTIVFDDADPEEDEYRQFHKKR